MTVLQWPKGDSHRMFGAGTPDNPWVCELPCGEALFSAYRDKSVQPPELVIRTRDCERRLPFEMIEALTSR
jgi:hypothetical protein